jgi:hypothetical protein
MDFEGDEDENEAAPISTTLASEMPRPDAALQPIVGVA